MPTASSPIGRALRAVLEQSFAGNGSRFALALGISRSTMYEWLGNPRPYIARLAHRQAIADVLGVHLATVDALIVEGLGYRVSPVRTDAVALAVLASQLDPDDVVLLERQALAMLRRDAWVRGAVSDSATPLL